VGSPIGSISTELLTQNPSFHNRSRTPTSCSPGHRNPTFGRADLLHARRFGSVRMCRHPAPLRRCEAVVCLRVCVQSVLGHERIDQVGWQRLRSCAPKLRNRGRRRHGFNFGLGEMFDRSISLRFCARSILLPVKFPLRFHAEISRWRKFGALKFGELMGERWGSRRCGETDRNETEGDYSWSRHSSASTPQTTTPNR